MLWRCGLKPSGIGPYKVAYMECPYCKESLRIVALADGRELATERATGREHECWDLPEGVELLVMDD